MNITQAQKIAQHFNLGNIISNPKKVEGGLCHLMWRINTDTGDYAVKQLNPAIISKPGVPAKYELAKSIARQFAQHCIPVATALEKDNKSLITVDGKSFIVYKWAWGTTLDMDGASIDHAKKIGNVIARIHQINLSIPELSKPAWDMHSNEHFIELKNKTIKAKLRFASEFGELLNDLLSSNDKYQHAIPSLNSNLVVSHGDLDQKNVMWQGGDCILIDWESARLLNPTQEIISVALDWSGLASLNLNEEIFAAVLTEYKNAGGVIDDNIDNAFYGVIGNWLNWLEFNLRRSLGDGVRDNDERKLGVEQVEHTLKLLQYLMCNIERWKNKCTKIKMPF